jgi:NADH:ubiquinone oxidoreductase subunit 6 (subunit J)
MELFLPSTTISTLLPFLAIIAALFVITTQNPIYSVFNLIILYILVAFFLIFKGIAYIGISYIIIVRRLRVYIVYLCSHKYNQCSNLITVSGLYIGVSSILNLASLLEAKQENKQLIFSELQAVISKVKTGLFEVYSPLASNIGHNLSCIKIFTYLLDMK